MATTADPDRKSREALFLAACALLPFVVASIPDLVQEVYVGFVLVLVGVGLTVAALVRAGFAVDAKRSAGEAAWVAYLAVVISLLPVLATPLLLIRASS